MLSTRHLLLTLGSASTRRTYNTNVKPLQDLAKDFPHVGMLLVKRQTTNHFYRVGSGVYDDGIVISSAHCFTPYQDTQLYFMIGNDTSLRPIKIKTIVTHPEFNDNQATMIDGQSDIGVAILEKKFPVELPKLNIEYDPTPAELKDCVSIGYPAMYSPIHENNYPLLLKKYNPNFSEPHIPIAVIASCNLSTKYPNCLEHQIGYHDAYPLPYNILDSGLHSGMSGGGLFTREDKKLVGLNMSTTGTNDFSHQRGNYLYFNFIKHNKAFLMSQLGQFKTALPTKTQKKQNDVEKNNRFKIL